MRVIDTSVPAKGFKAHDGQTFKILASYDGICNVTKIYINDKLRGIANPFDMGQYVWQPFGAFSFLPLFLQSTSASGVFLRVLRFLVFAVNVSNNFFESITLGHSLHSRRAVPTASAAPDAATIAGGTGGVGSQNVSVPPGNLYIRTGDWQGLY